MLPRFSSKWNLFKKSRRDSASDTQRSERRRRHRHEVELLEARLAPSAAPIQFFYVPMPEQPVRTSFTAIDTTGTAVGNTIDSIITISATENNTIIYYDQHEDGYETNLGNPTQASTQIWGDGNPANGTPPGDPSDVINAGTVITLRNVVPANPRNNNNLFFDGGDLIGSSNTISISRAQFPVVPGSVIGSAVEVRDTRYFDTTYTSPVGTNTPNSGVGAGEAMFSYAAFYIMASQDNTTVQVDANNDGTFEQTVVLNAGQNLVSTTPVRQGGRVVADKPVQADLLTGDIGGQYGSRSYALLPDAQLTNDYFTPVGSVSANHPVALYVYNPNAFAITVNFETQTTSGALPVIPAGQSQVFTVPSATGTRLFSTGNFSALGADDAFPFPTGSDDTYDWGFMLQPVSSLSQIALVGLGVGNSDNPPSSAGAGGNTSPIWVTPLAATAVYVNFTGNPAVGPLIDPQGNHYDVSFALARLQLQRVLRTTPANINDNTGMRLYTVDGTLISTAWGEDPSTAPSGSPGFDVGTTVPAVPVPEFYKFVDFAPGGDANGDGFFNSGDTLRYTLRIRNIGTNAVTNSVITDALPPEITYIDNSTFIDQGGGPSAVPDNGTTPFPLDESGLTITNLATNSTTLVTFDVTINNGLPAGTRTITNRSNLAYFIFNLPAVNTASIRGTVGDRIWYDVNGDGVQDPGEPGIVGAIVTLTWFGPDGVPGGGDDRVFTTTTGVDGAYTFPNLLGGNYGIVVSGLPNGLTTQVSGPSTFTLGSGQIRTDIDLGFRGTGVVGNFVWHDLNGNGVQDAGEPGLDGVTVNLTWAGPDGNLNTAADNITYATTAAGGGLYNFANLPSGTFQAKFMPPAGFTFTAQSQGGNPALDSDPDPATGLTAPFVLGVGATNNGIDAGLLSSPDLAIVKSDGGISTTPDSVVPYTLTVTNNGNQDATGVVITESVPANTAFDAAASTAGWNAGGTSFTIGNLAAGVTSVVTYAVTVNATMPAGVTQLSNTATVADDGTNGADPTPADNGSTDTTPVTAQPDLSIVKSDGGISTTPDSVVPYTLTVTNNGNQDATGVVITESVPANTAFDAAASTAGWNMGGTSFTIGNLAAGVTTVVTYAVTVNATVPAGVTQLSNTATVADDGTNGADPTPADNGSTDTTPVTAQPDLSIVKSDGGISTTPGSVVPYTLTVTNNGNQDATGVVITESVPANTAFDAAASTAGWNTGGTSFTIGNLAAGVTTVVTYAVTVNATVPAGVTQLSNTATVADDGTNGADPTPADNGSTDTTPVTAQPDLSIVKSDGGISTTPGSVVPYTLTVTNNGNQDATGVVITESVPANTAFDAAASTAGWNTGGTSFTIGNLAAGVTTVVTYAVTVNATVPAGVTQLSNTATVADDGTNGADPTPANNSGTDTTPVQGAVLSGTVFIDTNVDGLASAGEPGLGGVFIQLLNNSGTAITTTTSPIDGTYTFGLLGPGGYTLLESQPNGYGSSTPNSLSVNLTLAGLANQNFGETLASFSGNVYVDINNDGIRQAGEPGIFTPSLTLTLTGTDANGGTVSETTSTIPGGTYSFIGLLAGTYTIAESQPAGFADGKDAVGSAGGTLGNDVLSNIPLGPAVNATGYNFGEQGTVISGKVFIDANQDNFLNPGEAGLGGVAVSLLDSTGIPIAFAVTAPDGSYLFANVTPGTYTIVRTPPVGYGSPFINGFTGVVPSFGLFINFPEVLSSLSGTVYADANGNGTLDAGEVGIPGVTVTLTGTDAAGGTVMRSLLSGPDGTYTFTNLLSGTYTVTETQPAGFADGQDSVGLAGGTLGNDIVSNIALPVAVTAPGYNFGELGTAVSGFVFLDADANGMISFGDSVLGGVTLQLQNGATVVATTTTAADGYYLFTNVASGVYSIVETQPPGYGSSTPNTLPVTVTAAGVNNQNFGETLGSLAGNVYVDANNDGIRQAGEAGIGTVTVLLSGTDASGAPVNRVATTASDGTYSFPSLLSGTYTITEIPPVGFASGKDTAGTAGGTPGQNVINGIDLVASVNALNYNFGHLNNPASFSGMVYVDADGSGTLTAGDPGIGGVTVTLSGTDANGAVNVTLVTQANGAYSFTGLNAGTYTITETQPAGFADGPDTLGSAGGTLGNDTVTNITLAQGQSGTGYNFGETGPFVSGTVFVDSNVNGTQEAGESGLGGVVVTVTDARGTVIGTATTAGDGSYLIGGIVAGTYTITETQPAGYASSTPNAIGPVAVPATGLAGTNFGETVGSIAGIVYSDLDTSLTRNAGDGGIAGVVATLTGTDVNGLVINRMAVSAADGSYHFDGLLQGTYTLTEAQPTGYFHAADAAGNAGGTVGPPSRARHPISGIALGAGIDATGYLFGQVPPADPFGFVWNDLNNNGIREAGEPGIAGVLINLAGTDFLGNAVADSRVTDANGFYQFAVVPPGTYSLSETQPAGFLDGKEQNGDPNAPAPTVGNDVFSNIILNATNLAERGPFSFGELVASSLSGFVYADANNDGIKQAGEAGIGGVQITLTGTDDLGTAVNLMTTTAAGTGAYAFANLRPGTYTITETQPDGFLSGKNSIGSQSGTVGNDTFTITLAQGTTGINNNFAELPANSNAGFERDVIIPGVTFPIVLPNDAGKGDLLGANPPANIMAQAVYVNGLYHELLQRAPDQDGENYFFSLLQAGVARQQVVQTLWRSPEHRWLQVDGYFQTFLHRNADPGGRAFFVSQFLAGAGEVDIGREFLLSGEYQAGHPDAGSFVVGLYTDVLARAPDAGGQAFYTQQLSNGVSRSALALSFLTSAEADGRIVDRFYLEYFQRAADSGGRAFWIGQLQSGRLTPESLGEILLATDEYFAKAH